MASTWWSRLIPTRRRVVTYILVILAILVVRLVLGFWAGHRLQSVSDRLAATYGGLDLASLAPTPVAPFENRARIFSAAASLNVERKSASGWSELNRAIANVPPIDPAKRLATLRLAAMENELALQLLDRAESRPKANWEIPYRDGARMRLPSLLEIRELSTVNVAAGLASLLAGNADDASRRAGLGIALGNSLGQEPLLIIQLIRIAVEREPCRLIRTTLVEGEPGTMALSALAAQLELTHRGTPSDVGLIGEMKYVNSQLSELGRGGEPRVQSDSRVVALGGAALAWVVRPAVLAAQAQMLGQLDELIQYARLQPFERDARRLHAPTDRPQPWWWRPFPFLQAPGAGLGRAIQSGDEHRALMTIAATAVALRRFRLDHGVYPAGLAELVPALLPQTPVDPYTGHAPEYALARSGFTLRVMPPAATQAATRELLEWKVPR